MSRARVTERVPGSVTTMMASASVCLGWWGPGVTSARLTTGASASTARPGAWSAGVARPRSTPSATSRPGSAAANQGSRARSATDVSTDTGELGINKHTCSRKRF